MKNKKVSIVWGMINNTEVVIEKRESGFQPCNLDFAIGEVKIWYPTRGS